MKAFVSSTFDDLREHRAHVIAALRRAGVHVDPMEDWTTTSSEPKHFCRERLNGCDLCVLIVARRRGFKPIGEVRSITQMEYDAANERGIEVLAFLLEDSALWKREWDELDSDAELREWRAELCARQGVEFFTHDPRSIDVVPAVARWVAQKKESPSAPTSPFITEWYIFAPFCPGIKPPIAMPVEGFRLVKSDAESSVFEWTDNPDISLRWFSFGGAIWTKRMMRQFSSLTDLAEARRTLYRAILKGDHDIKALTREINNHTSMSPSEAIIDQQPIGYALSLISLIEPGWPKQCVANALQILSCPNLLLDTPAVEDGDDEDDQVASQSSLEKEAFFLSNGAGGADLREFSQREVVHGFACWAGVSTHIQPNLRPKLTAAYVDFEEQIQTLWWRIHSFESLFDSGEVPREIVSRLSGIERMVHKALRVGPTEITALRLFKEAVISTSRIESVLREFRQSLHHTPHNHE